MLVFQRIAEAMETEMKRWAAGKEGNLRALLSSLQQVYSPSASSPLVKHLVIILCLAQSECLRDFTNVREFWRVLVTSLDSSLHKSSHCWTIFLRYHLGLVAMLLEAIIVFWILRARIGDEFEQKLVEVEYTTWCLFQLASWATDVR